MLTNQFVERVVCRILPLVATLALCVENVTFAEDCVLTCPSNITVFNPEYEGGVCGAVVTYPDPTTSGDCFQVQCSPPSGSVFPVGTNVVDCTDGNTAFCTFLVTVIDNEAPTIFNCPSDITTPTAPGQCGATVNFNVMADDNCSNSQTVLCSPPSGSFFSSGATLVKCWAQDTEGNTSDTCRFTVTVVDFDCPGLISRNTDPGECSAAVEYTITPNGNCPGTLTIVCNPPSGSEFPVGDNSVTCTATDQNNNTSSCTFTVRVTDNQDPVITCARDTTIECSTSTSPDDLGYATATDNCEVLEITYQDQQGAFLGCPFPHRITRTWTAEDVHGNETTCEQIINVNDTTPPEITCPGNIVLPGEQPQVVTYTASATDECDSHLDVPVCTPPSGSTFPVGITTVTCTATDCDNNMSTCTFTVAVAVPAAIDVKPGSCPNPLKISDRGLISVAVVGGGDFDVSQIDPSTVQLEGVAATQWVLADVASPFLPYIGKTSCSDCEKSRKDRTTDMVFKFDSQTLIEALRPITDGECRVVRLVGLLNGGTAFVGEDVVRTQGTLGRVGGEEGHSPVEHLPTAFILDQCYPNPFNPTTRIGYALPEPVHVRLVVYDVLGQVMKVLVDEIQSAGYHSVEWNATNESGLSLSSGVYLYRLNAGKFSDLKKMVLAR